MGKAFIVRRVIRRWKRIQQNYRRAMVGRTKFLRPNVSPMASPDRLSDDPPQKFQSNHGANNLRNKGCPDYPSLQQLFAPSTTTGNLQISSNTPPLNSDEERALEEKLANANANANDAEVEEVTQQVEKRPVQDVSGKGKKVSRKLNRISEMTVALREYTAMSRDKFSGKLGKGSGSSNQFT
nr:hypothetical protein CFP56_18475 [Quercus suber]